jgi:hypothetical protein
MDPTHGPHIHRTAPDGIKNVKCPLAICVMASCNRTQGKYFSEEVERANQKVSRGKTQG